MTGESSYPRGEREWKPSDEAAVAHATRSIRERIIEGLEAGWTLIIDRLDSPALPVVIALIAEGLVSTELRQIDEQSSALRVQWKRAPEAEAEAEADGK